MRRAHVYPYAVNTECLLIMHVDYIFSRTSGNFVVFLKQPLYSATVTTYYEYHLTDKGIKRPERLFSTGTESDPGIFQILKLKRLILHSIMLYCF